MDLDPEKIWEDFENNRIDRSTVFQLLTALVENSKNEDIRLNAIKNLIKICPINDKIFNFLEYILVSDESDKIRYITVKFIGEKFLLKANSLLNWAINHENDYNTLIEITKLLGKLDNNETKLVLFNEIKKITKSKYMNKKRKIENKKFKKVLKKMLKKKNYEDFTHYELVQILINYFTISNLFKQYYNVYYEVDSQNGLIEKLDLSDFIEYEVKGTPWDWKNNITDLSEIPGFTNLNHIKYIDLSNNQIEDIKDLIHFQELTHLIINNNKLSAEVNLDYLKNLPNLIYLDLRGNDIVNNIKPNDFPPKTRVLLKDSYIKIE
ncbi:MAG: hypothetical protein ACFFG0_15210 [Candidatus Thorarchaeota archaeon]